MVIGYKVNVWHIMSKAIYKQMIFCVNMYVPTWRLYCFTEITISILSYKFLFCLFPVFLHTIKIKVDTHKRRLPFSSWTPYCWYLEATAVTTAGRGVTVQRHIIRWMEILFFANTSRYLMLLQLPFGNSIEFEMSTLLYTNKILLFHCLIPSMQTS